MKLNATHRGLRQYDDHPLTHLGRVRQICVGNLTIIGPDNGLSPGQRQAIIWTNAGILLIGPWGTKFSEILIGIQTFSFKKMHFKCCLRNGVHFCLGLNVLICNRHPITHTHRQAMRFLLTEISKWQLLVKPIIKKSSKLQLFDFRF